MKIKKLISVIAVLTIIFGFSPLCFAENEEIEAPDAYVYNYSYKVQSYDKQRYDPKNLILVKLVFGENVVSSIKRVYFTYSGSSYETVDLTFDEESHTVSFTATKYPSDILMPADMVFDASGKGNKKMSPKKFIRKSCSIDRTDPMFEDTLYGGRYHKVGENIDLSISGDDAVFDVFEDGMELASGVAEFSVPILSGYHIVLIKSGEAEIKFEYQGKEKVAYGYSDRVGYEMRKGLELMAGSFTAPVVTIAALAIPVIGPILSAMSLVLVPIYGLGGLFAGLGKIVAAPFTAMS